MEFVILTGMSGAGKTNALHALEDIGYYCVDNLPPLLLGTFYELCVNSADTRMKKVAIVADARSGQMFAEMDGVINDLRMAGKQFRILFLDAKPDTLLNRYKETRRKHPLSNEVSGKSVENALELESELLKGIKASADCVIDTTCMTLNQLKERVTTLYSSEQESHMQVTVVSFGFKYGIPREADLVIDVRCLPNPYYVEELKSLTGLDEEVREYVMQYDISDEFMRRLFDFIDYSIPLYRKEGKYELVIGIGCTGGKHRSVTVARALNAHLMEDGERSSIHHRDIWKA